MASPHATAVVPTNVDPSTGEALSTEGFDFTAYLATLTRAEGLEQQQALAKAYDAACRALIGPNDVQKDGDREYKKKSAWRKLQRHFGISTVVVRKDTTYHDHAERSVFVATVAMRAIAPWGQHAEAIGACGQDEEKGRRKITIADAIATAETRATNRAVSNLIAMGEVSAEEIGDRGSPLPTTIPFGKDKGKPLVECTDEHLVKIGRWCESKGKFPDLVEAIAQRLEERRQRRAHGPQESFEDVPAAMQAGDAEDDLPFE